MKQDRNRFTFLTKTQPVNAKWPHMRAYSLEDRISNLISEPRTWNWELILTNICLLSFSASGNFFIKFHVSMQFDDNISYELFTPLKVKFAGEE